MRGRGRGEGRLAKASRPCAAGTQGTPPTPPRGGRGGGAKGRVGRGQRPRGARPAGGWARGAVAAGGRAGGRAGRQCPAALRGPARRARSPGCCWVTLPQGGPGGVRPHCASAERAFLGAFCALPLAASHSSSGVNFIKKTWRRWFDLFCIFI